MGETGGKGGDGNLAFGRNGFNNSIEVSGSHGERGENCGEVNIFDFIKVFAYGGKGGSSLEGKSRNSGFGGGGYPSAGIGRRRSRSVVGGDHWEGGRRIFWWLWRRNAYK